MFEGVRRKENSTSHALGFRGRCFFLVGDGLALLMDLAKYKLTYVVPAQACRGKAGRESKRIFCQIALD